MVSRKESLCNMFCSEVTFFSFYNWFEYMCTFGCNEIYKLGDIHKWRHEIL